MKTNKNWNLLDTVIFSCENFLHMMKEKMLQHKEDAPEPEVIIAAATEYLQQENEKLKHLQFPEKVELVNEEYYCPECQNKIEKALLDIYRIKYCPECGKRIFLSDSYKYAISHISK